MRKTLAHEQKESPTLSEESDFKKTSSPTEDQVRHC